MELGKQITKTAQEGILNAFNLSEAETAMIRKITDVARIEFEALNYLYRVIKIQGFASVTDILQFVNLGIPIYQYLYEIVGVYPDQLRGYVNESKTTYFQVKEAFTLMTSDGGIFQNIV